MRYDDLKIRQCSDNGDTRFYVHINKSGNKFTNLGNLLSRHLCLKMVELLIDASECCRQTFSYVNFHADFKDDVGLM